MALDAGTGEIAVSEQVMRLKMRVRPGTLTGAVAQDPRHRQRRVVVQHRLRNPSEVGEGADMPVEERLRRLPGICLDEPNVAVRQNQAEERDLLPPASNLHHRFAEIGLSP